MATAAQYIRMSTDTQQLSPALQKRVIGQYAQDHALQLVASYEDEGRSGLTLKHRHEMRRLLRDVASDACPFDVVLVYDVSRWGRFQDTDESAYYEFHCRLHGVRVVYVNEPFEAGQTATPMTALLKALKRAMAAEFSRELALKVQQAQRSAVALGFQIGRLPCIGVSRLACSSAGASRPLGDGERPRKGERVVWVPGPPHELALVRRIFSEYVTSAITLNALVAKLNAEEHTARGRPFTRTMVRCLMGSEILYGDFVWGRRKAGARAQRRLDGDPAIVRGVSVMEPIVPRELWERAQAKRRAAFHVFGHTRESLLAELRCALQRNPALTVTDMASEGCASIGVYRKAFGSMREAMRQAGRPDSALKPAYLQRKSQAHALSNQFGRDLRALLTAGGVAWERPGKDQLLLIGGQLTLRFKLVAQRPHRQGLRWHFERVRLGPYDYMLLVPLDQHQRAAELLLLTAAQFRGLRTWFDGDSVVLHRRCHSGEELLQELRTLLAGLRRGMDSHGPPCSTPSDRPTPGLGSLPA